MGRNDFDINNKSISGGWHEPFSRNSVGPERPPPVIKIEVLGPFKIGLRILTQNSIIPFYC